MGVKIQKDPITGKVKLVSDQPKAGNAAPVFNGVPSLNVVNTEDGPLPIMMVSVGDGKNTPFDLVAKQDKPDSGKKLKHLMLGKAQTIPLSPEKGKGDGMALLQNWAMADASFMATDHQLNSYLIDYQVHKNGMTMATECEFKFVFGSRLRVSIPDHMLHFNGKVNMLDLLDLATRHGYLSYGQESPQIKTHFLITGEVAPVCKNDVPPYTMMMGGARNGDIMNSTMSVVKHTEGAALSTMFMPESDDVVPPTFTVSRYFRENVAFNCKGLTTTAPVYRHESIPGDQTARMFEMMLDEFPLLRCIPAYSLYWWSHMK